MSGPIGFKIEPIRFVIGPIKFILGPIRFVIGPIHFLIAPTTFMNGRMQEQCGSIMTVIGSETNRLWIAPHFGKLPLDAITDVRVGALRGLLAKSPGRKPGSVMSEKRINNVLTVVLSALKLALKWKVIGALPCSIEIPAIDDARPAYFDFDDYARLCNGALQVGTHAAVVVRLGGDAGLRRGEMMCLRWDHVDFARRQILIDAGAHRRSERMAKLHGGPQVVIAKPKGGKARTVDMSNALVAALKNHRHLKGEYVLCMPDGSMCPGHILKDMLEAAEKKAGLPIRGALHRLRHTFCTHLAMRGASQRAIQALAGHASGSTTQRYMWASPASTSAAIALLNEPAPAWAMASNDAE